MAPESLQFMRTQSDVEPGVLEMGHPQRPQRYVKAQTSGFVAEFAQESNSDDSDDLALRSSSDISDTDTLEKVFVRHRTTPHGSPRSGRASPRLIGTSPGSGRISPRPGTTTFKDRLLDPGDCGRWGGVTQKHLYTNFATDDSFFAHRLRVGGSSQGAVAHKVIGLPTLLTPQDEREVRYAQLQLSTPSTPASGPRTPSSVPLTPSSNPPTPLLHPHTGPSPISPGLQRSLSPLTRTSLKQPDPHSYLSV
ncbi:uncharacterized protein LOC121878856 [Homarus americanus]|uniref:Putative tyrosine kinase insulin receptor-like n=1 Tax=Homarus americanus TaxID=6706 RepID=A0A8J5MP29_HOMAM|nr:uncharacterized protein LOC121878856 [Homarus americanus]KAG7158390.1 putative tyrosine kinase insulin receptor-like [Homarus americanus]